VFKKKISYLIFFFILLNPTLIQANSKIFYLDMDYVMNNSLAGKSITEQLNKINKENIKIFNKKEKNLKTEEAKIIAQKSILAESEYKKKIILFKEKISNFNIERKNLANNFKNKRIKAQTELVNSLTSIIADYAKKNAAEIIIDKKNIVLGKSELDITQNILKTLDTKIKNIKLK
jgi:outer membrane protein